MEGIKPALAGFTDLPTELQVRILTMACYTKRPTPTLSSDAPWCPLIDAQAAIALSLTSRDVKRMVYPIFWKQIEVTRPSTLRLLCHAVAGRPDLASLVGALYIGPASSLPADWFPVEEDEHNVDSDFISQDPDFALGSIPFSIPSSVSTKRWSLDKAEKGCRGQAVLGALRAAAEGIGVDLKREGKDFERGDIGSATWLIRIFQVQAALDLYLQSIREMPSAQQQQQCGCRYGTCPPYHDLAVHEDTALPAPPSPLGVAPRLTLSSASLEQHLTRRFARTDRLDHPLLFARSGIDVRPHKVRLQVLEGQLDSLQMPLNAHFPFGDAFIALDSVMHGIRFLLSTTPKLETLALTGFLERAVGGADTTMPGSLKLYSMGPAAFDLLAPPRLEGMNTLTTLRIHGLDIDAEDANSILTALPNIKELHWVTGVKSQFDGRLLIQVIDALMLSPILVVHARLHRQDVELLSAHEAVNGDDDEAPRLFLSESPATAGEWGARTRSRLLLEEQREWWLSGLERGFQ